MFYLIKGGVLRDGSCTRSLYLLVTGAVRATFC